MCESRVCPHPKGFADSKRGKHVRKGDICLTCSHFPSKLAFPKNAIFGCITRKKHRGQTAVYLSYIRVALGVSDEVRRQIARF